MEGEGVIDLQSQALVWNHLFGVVNTFVLKCAINLNIIDIISRYSRPITLSELSSSLPVPCTNLPILRRIMRYLAHMHLITVVDDEESYALTPASKFLIKGGEKSLVPFAKLILYEDSGVALHALESCLNAEPGMSAYEKVKGESLWACASRNPAQNEVFNEAMASSARLAIPGVMEACRKAFEGMGSLVDVGGGNGTTARAIAKEFPHIRCTVFDLPHVVAEAAVKFPGIIDYVGGDMLKSSLPRADGVILMWILHDWTDEECIKLLKRCKEAIPEEGGKVIIVDAVVGENEEPELYHARLALDIAMMAFTGGKERNEKEWRGLLKSAGFTQCKITPIRAMQHAIEACPWSERVAR